MNPGYAFGVYTISNRAPSASSDISPYSVICYHVAKKYYTETNSSVKGFLKSFERKNPAV